MELIIPIVRLNKAILQTSQSLKMKKLHSKKKLGGRPFVDFQTPLYNSNSYSNCYTNGIINSNS